MKHIKKYLKYIYLGVRNNLWLFIFIILLLVLFFIVHIEGLLLKNLENEFTAQRWESAEKMKFSQISVFLAEKEAFHTSGLQDVRNTIESTIFEGNFENKVTGRIWMDAYASTNNLSVMYKDTYINVEAYGVGGEFFRFHPYKLLSGNYFEESDLMQDKIVLDKNTAWKLFGSSRVNGKMVWIGDRAYYVSGVVEEETGLYAKEAYGNSCKIYLPYEELCRLEEKSVITCYEVVLPNFVNNYAVDIISELFDVTEEEKKSGRAEVEIIENSGRFSISSLWEGIKTFQLKSMKTNHIAYPGWENRARAIESLLAMLLVVKTMVLVVAVIMLLVLGIKCCKSIITK